MRPGLPKIFLVSFSERQGQESILDDSWMFRLSDGDGGVLQCVCVLCLVSIPSPKRSGFHGSSAFMKSPVPLEVIIVRLCRSGFL
jgi:hypothetical protein